METQKDPNIMPIFGLFPRLEKVGQMLGRAVSFLPDTPLSRGDHTFEKAGAAQMLDDTLEPGGRWSDMGEY